MSGNTYYSGWNSFLLKHPYKEDGVRKYTERDIQFMSLLSQNPFSEYCDVMQALTKKHDQFI